MDAIDIWYRWNTERYDILRIVGHNNFEGFLNAYITIEPRYVDDKLKFPSDYYIEVYFKIVDYAALNAFVNDATKAYMRFDSGGAGKCLYCVVGYKI